MLSFRSAKPAESPASDEVVIVKKGPTAVKSYPAAQPGKRLFTVTWFVAGRRNIRNFADEAEAQWELPSWPPSSMPGDVQILTLLVALFNFARDAGYLHKLASERSDLGREVLNTAAVIRDERG